MSQMRKTNQDMLYGQRLQHIAHVTFAAPEQRTALLLTGPGLVGYHMELLLTLYWPRMERWFIFRLATVLLTVCGWIIGCSVLMILADRLSRKAAPRAFSALISELRSTGGPSNSVAK